MQTETTLELEWMGALDFDFVSLSISGCSYLKLNGLKKHFTLKTYCDLLKQWKKKPWYCGLWKGAFWDIGYLTAEGDLIIPKNVIWGLNILLSFSCLMFWKFWVVKSPGIDLHFIFWCLFFFLFWSITFTAVFVSRLVCALQEHLMNVQTLVQV